MTSVDVSALTGASQGESVPFKATEQTPKLDDLETLRNLRVSGTVTQLGDRLLAKGTLETNQELTCVRCMKSFPLRRSETFSEEFSEAPTEDQFPAEKERLDLRPMLRAVLLSTQPERPLHDPGCKGLCDVCGKDLNAEPHTHDKPKPPGPFDKLKDARPRKR